MAGGSSSALRAALLVLFVACTGFAQAQVPRTLHYQGFLTNAAGVPLNATLSMVFSIYASTGGNEILWDETHNPVQVTNGRFAVTLGGNTPLTLPFDQEYFLGVAVGGDNEMSPRQRLAAAPYAHRAASVDGAGVSGDIIVGKVTYSAPREHRIVIGESMFRPRDSTEHYLFGFGPGGAHLTGGGNGGLMAPLANVPVGATVTGVALTVSDTNSAINLRAVLGWHYFAEGSNVFEGETTTDGTPGTATLALSFTPFLYQADASLALRVLPVLQADGGFSPWPSGGVCPSDDCAFSLRVNAAVVTYTLPEAP